MAEFVKGASQQQNGDGQKNNSRRRRRNASKTSLGDMLEDSEPASSGGRTVEIAAASSKSESGGLDKKRHKRGRGRGAGGGGARDAADAGAENTAMDTTADNDEAEDEEDDRDTNIPAEASVLTTHLTSQEFDSLHVAPKTKEAIKNVLKFRFMTDVQAQSIPHIIKGTDVFVKARTGTGKTLAFLIPAIEVLLAHRQRGSSGHSMILVLSPTRELALQISVEAVAVSTYHKFSVATFVGGTNTKTDARALNRPQGVDILVATPGRLLMHLQETNGFADRVKGVKVLVFDEADRLLDMGFKREIDQIMTYIPTNHGPHADRQTLLFSATFSKEVKEVAAVTLRRGYTVVDTVGEEEEQTHAHVPQQMIVVPLEHQAYILASILKEQIGTPPYKIIVFFTTARLTGYFAELMNAIGITTLEIHSRKSQSQRTKASEEFRKARSAIMFSSDVTARGMDYPDVTLVVQVGMTTREQYIHRLGRTARAGKQGSGLLLIAPFEASAIRRELNDMPLVELTAQVPGAFAPLAGQIDVAQRNLHDSASPAWISWLGFYKGYLKKLNWSVTDLIATAHQLSATFTLAEIPAIQKKTIGKMGLKGVPGLRIDNSPPDEGGRGGGGRGRGGGGKRPQLQQASDAPPVQQGQGQQGQRPPSQKSQDQRQGREQGQGGRGQQRGRSSSQGPSGQGQGRGRGGGFGRGGGRGGGGGDGGRGGGRGRGGLGGGGGGGER